MARKFIVGNKYRVVKFGGRKSHFLIGALVRVQEVSATEMQCRCIVLRAKRKSSVGKSLWFYAYELSVHCIFNGGSNEYS